MFNMFMPPAPLPTSAAGGGQVGTDPDADQGVVPVDAWICSGVFSGPDGREYPVPWLTERARK
eukprot:13725459-Alexandrium_andersonii.AAC.1